MSLFDLVRDIGISVSPGLIVGCGYRFGTVFAGKTVSLKGRINCLVIERESLFRYEVSGEGIKGVNVIGLIKVKEEWMLQVDGGQTFTLYLPGNFEIL